MGNWARKLRLTTVKGEWGYRVACHPISPVNFRPVRQIESDPKDANTFYVLTWTGLYTTHDLDKTFRLLPTATEYFYQLDAIGVWRVEAMEQKRRHNILGALLSGIWDNDPCW
jgi:hypothetical protein